MKVVKNFSNKDKEVIFDSVKILGGNEKLLKWYANGNLDTLMLVGEKGFDCINALGTSCSKPIRLIELFKFIARVCNVDNENLSSMNIFSPSPNTILVEAFCGGKEQVFFTFSNKDGVIELDANDESDIEYDDIPHISKLLYDVILWANKVSPVPVFSIGYYFSSDSNTRDCLGRGEFFMGLSEANKVNGVNMVGCSEDKVKGEYALVILESEVK